MLRAFLTFITKEPKTEFIIGDTVWASQEKFLKKFFPLVTVL